MIIFKKISYQNFLSTGNAANTVLLNKSHSTLIVGKNGEGKSTVLDALCFGLFGKPFRDITKPQLVNSINGKKCLVEIEFSVDNKDYKVIRGIKPNVFEIWCNGIMLNQDAASKDYQKALEQQILRLNYKTFTQVVILGSASFVPFMQLKTSERREVIEDILDIKIFSTMNQLLKEKAQATKDEILRLEDAILLAREKVNAQKKLIETIQSAKTDNIERLDAKIQQALAEIAAEQERVASLESEIATLMERTSNVETIKSDVRKANNAIAMVTSRITSLQEHVSFLQGNTTCPTCEQDIEGSHKQKTIQCAEATLVTHDGEKETLQLALEKLNVKLQNITDIQKEILNKNIELSTVNNTISMLNKHIAGYNYEIADHKTDNADIDQEKSALKDLANNAMAMLGNKTRLAENKNLQEIAGLLLKDTGIKTAIIREYLPVMNKLINKYLNIMDSYIHFELDEAFNEVIKSRFRDEFTYASFSEGEKQKIDIALLFAWRSIAKMKNSVNTNLLIMDEIFDSSLDANATELLMALLDQFGNDTNIFVISHRSDQLHDKFHSVIQVVKKNDFSVIVDARS